MLAEGVHPLHPLVSTIRLQPAIYRVWHASPSVTTHTVVVLAGRRRAG
jgi:hypothetical protein